MSRIVVLVGSMRKGGNTDLLAQSFADGASKNNIVELVSVADYNINPCVGCNSCFTREGNQCFQNDDMPAIYDKLRNADIEIYSNYIEITDSILRFLWKHNIPTVASCDYEQELNKLALQK